MSNANKTPKALRPTSETARTILAIVLHAPDAWVALDSRGWIYGGGNNVAKLRASFPNAQIITSEDYRVLVGGR